MGQFYLSPWVLGHLGGDVAALVRAMLQPAGIFSCWSSPPSNAKFVPCPRVGPSSHNGPTLTSANDMQLGSSLGRGGVGFGAATNAEPIPSLT